MTNFSFPVDWKRLPLKSTANNEDNSFIDGDWIEANYLAENGIRLIQTGNIGIGKYLDKPNNAKYISESTFDDLSCKLVKSGDILICRLAEPVGRACIVPGFFQKAITSVDCTIFRPESSKIDKAFISHWLSSEHHLKVCEDLARGSTRQRISRSSLGKVVIPIPELKEQKAIATILDTIDEAITAAEAQLAKQEKIKQGLLQDLLTRGIDQTGQIRPHWEDRPDLYKKTVLGLIPIAWEINLLGNICARGGGNVQTGPFGSQLHAEDYKDQGIPIITVEHLNELFISHKNLPLVGNEDYFRLRKYDLETGDLVFSRVGAIDRCSYVTEQENGWLFSGRCLRVRAGNSINSKYLAFVLNSHRQRQWILNAAVGSTMACLNTSILSNVPITEPAEYEQKFVADNLFEVTSVANELKADVRKLQSIKTGLMQDLLTGQRRVTPELIRQVETLASNA